jgi:hypothetical protein
MSSHSYSKAKHWDATIGKHTLRKVDSLLCLQKSCGVMCLIVCALSAIPMHKHDALSSRVQCDS